MYPNKNEIKSLHSLFGTLEIEKKKEISSKLENFISKKKIYFIIGILLILFTVILIILSSNDNKKKEENLIIKEKYNNIEEKIIESFSKYYSPKTKNYINFISELEKKNYIAYYYDFQNNSKGSFSNKYQYLYEYDTSLIPNNSEIGYSSFHNESYLTIETDEISYYKKILQKQPPNHFIYGPSSIIEEYNKGQKLSNPNNKINNTKDWEGITISINIKQFPKMGNNNGGIIFGWGNSEWAKPGFFIGLSYGAIKFKQGIKIIQYSYED